MACLSASKQCRLVVPPASASDVRGPKSATTDGRRLLSTAGAVWRGFKRLTRLGWPRRFPIVQFPNAPLIVSFVAGQVAAHTHGAVHAYASAISYLAFAIWTYEELAHGVNWFRHLLGLGYAISTIIHLAHALQS